MSNKIKNLISLSAFVLFIVIGCVIFVRRYNLKSRANEIATMFIDDQNIDNVDTNDNNSNEAVNQNDINSSNENSDNNIEAKLLKNSYDDFGFLDVTSLYEKEEIRKDNEKIFEEYEKYKTSVRNNDEVPYYVIETEYVNELYNKACFIGDSNVLKIRRLKYLPEKNIYPFGAETLESIIAKADNLSVINVEKFNSAIVWIGYNIKYIEDSNHIINEFNRITEKLKKQNENIKVYMCSILPATQEKIEEDLSNGAIHNFYRGPEYDSALKEHFKDLYIDTKIFINSPKDYTSDGFHMQTTFYDKMIPYVGFYINFMQIKDKYNQSILDAENANVATISSLHKGNGKIEIPTLHKENDESFNVLYEEFKNEVEKNKNCNQFFDKFHDYIMKLLDGVRFIGDSNAYQFLKFELLSEDYVGQMKGMNLYAQYDVFEDIIKGNEKTIICWNGYNIKYFNDAKDYITAYEKNIERIHMINKDCKIYICSLLPARAAEVEKDLKSDFVHKLYMGPEFDKAIKEHFSDIYIDTKPFLFDDSFYQSDGTHLSKDFIKMLICYVAFYINQ